MSSTYLLFITLITQARICFRVAVITTDMGLHSECLPRISRHPPLKYKVNLSTLSDHFTLVD